MKRRSDAAFSRLICARAESIVRAMKTVNPICIIGCNIIR
jgi:hypothetical protein